MAAIYGTDSADVIDGGVIGDEIYGGSGNDVLTGIAGVPHNMGAPAGPIYLTDAGGASGIDLIEGGSGDDAIYGFNGNDALYGGDGNDSGTIFNSTSILGFLWVGGLYGGLGNDYVDGGRGNDLLDGGADRDVLYGGSGADRFAFNRKQDSVIRSGRDVIRDFIHAEHDRIVLTLIDANSHKAGNQPFHYTGAAVFAHHAGELHEVLSTNRTIIEGDMNGDGKADFQIELTGHITLVKGDFAL